MALFRQRFTRATGQPDLAGLIAAVRPTIGDPFYISTQTDADVLSVVVEKPRAWAAGEVTAVQNAVTAATVTSARTEAQAVIDAMPILEKAIVLALIDQLNTIRAALPTPLGPITPAQALAAVRTKAGSL